jgi:albonoursin synthase
METQEAISSRRSIRAFTSDPVTDADMQKIIQAAVSAPNGGNAQMWVFISVRDPKRIAALRTLAPGIIGTPTAVIVMCLNKQRRTASAEGRLAAMPYFDLGAALQNILLAAHDIGLGGCAIGSFHPQGIASFLNLPENVEPCLLVVIGKPRVVPSEPRKRPLNEVYFEEKYDNHE